MEPDLRVLTGLGPDAPIEGPPTHWRSAAVTTTHVTEAALVQHEPRSCISAVDTHEKLVEDNNLQPVAHLERALRLADAVTLVQVPGRGSASGFLVGVDLLLTNHHVLRSSDEASTARARFNYQRDISGRMLTSEYFALRPDLLFYTNSPLDFTLVAVDGSPGNRYGVIPVGAPVFLQVGENVSIIQHPLGQPKQIAMTDNEVAFVDHSITQYLTDTLPGSSGSPVFSEEWELVALHHSGGWIPEPNTQSTHFRNEGIRISAILEDLAVAGLA